MDALSSGEPEPATRRGRLTVAQVVGITVLALAQFFDYGTFLILVGREGITAEANPIVVGIAQTAGVPGITIAKILTVAFAASLMILIAPRRPWLAYSLLVFGIVAGLVGGISNIASM